ncbi:MAG: hypothetical protein OJF47_001463 [Nitrospira sp.]|jgi:hypothetical protein|nr:MAG: hypothetical protein OJF47_001463 [Nitrospira sp.]
MARPRTKPTPNIDGRQERSLASTNESEQDSGDHLRDSHKNGNGHATDDTRTRIEKLAYDLYQRRGCEDGHDREDWLEAERLTLAQPASASRDDASRFSTSSPA